jgi:MFS family permease
VGEADERTQVSRLMLFFAIVYVVEGIGQARIGIIAQPLTYYLKDLDWTPVQITAFLGLFNFPWVIKPVFGLVSDFVPLFGYRRKAWLILASIGAIACYGAAAGTSAPGSLAVYLVLTAYCMAIASTLCGALLVEHGRAHGTSGAFVRQQWLWFNIATLATSLIGGELVEHLAPIDAMHAAAAVAAVAPVPVLVGCVLLIDEQRCRIDLAELRRTLAGTLATLRSRNLWLLAGFLFLYSFSPGFGTPLYFYMTDELHFSQSLIGLLGAISAAGWILGAFLHRWLLRDLPLRTLLNLSILLGTLTTAGFLFLRSGNSAVVVNLLAGIAGMVANIATLTLAADQCPERSEGFTFAALMSVINLAAPASDTAGALLYERVFGGRLAPLILVSAGFTAIAFALVPLLRLQDRPPHKAAPATAD